MAQGSTQVTLGGAPLVLLSVNPTLIIALIPADATPGSSLPLQVVRPAGSSVPRTVQIATVAPALFRSYADPASPYLADAQATRAGATFQVDLAHPAMAGDTLSLRAAGLGAVDTGGTER